MATRNGPNWGAGLQALGQGLGDMAEQKRREMAMKMLREQQQADLADQRAYDEKKWLERLNITDPLMPVPKDVREYVGMPETQVGPMPGMNLPQYERTSTVGNWQNMLPPAPRVSTKVPDSPDYYMQTPDGGYTGFSGQPWSAAGEGRRVNISGSYQDRPVVSLENWSAPKTPPKGPTPKSPDPSKVVADWYGGEKQSGDFDPKTGVATPFSYPFRGSVYDQASSALDLLPDLGNAVKNKLAVGDTIDDEAEARAVLAEVQSKYDVGLAQSLEQELGAAFQGWEPDTAGGKPIPGQYRKNNIPAIGGLSLNPLDRLARDEIKGAAEFYADIVNKQLADGTDEVEMRTINAWLKKKGLTLDQLSGYINTSRAQGVDLPAAGAAVINERNAPAAQQAESPPAPGAVKLSDGNWYIRNSSGKVVRYSGGQ